MTLKELHEVSMTKWLKLVALNWLEIITLLTLTHKIDHWAMYLVCWIVLGTRMHALALLGHEAIHYNLSKDKKLNDRVGNLLAALPLGMTVNWFRKFHLTHHNHLLSDQDPEVGLRSHALERWSTPLSTAKRIRLILLDLSGFGYLESRHVLTFAWPHMNKGDVIFPILYWSSLLTLFYFLGLLWIPLLWWISIPTSYWTMFRQRAISEHVGSTGTHRFHANPIARFFYLPHNTWYHWEHHEWQQIPCWNLPLARKLNNQVPVITHSELFRSLRDQR